MVGWGRNDKAYEGKAVYYRLGGGMRDRQGVNREEGKEKERVERIGEMETRAIYNQCKHM